MAFKNGLECTLINCKACSTAQAAYCMKQLMDKKNKKTAEVSDVR
jgi:hypothetical protein